MAKSIGTREFRLLAQLLRETRQRAGVTQADLANALKQTQSYVSKVERGECRLDLVQLRAFCHAVATTLPSFVEEYERLLRSSRR